MSQRTVLNGSIMAISACVAGFSYCASTLDDGYSPALSSIGTVAEGVALLTMIWSGLLMNRFKMRLFKWFSHTSVHFYSCLCICAGWFVLSTTLLSQAQYECQGQMDPDASLISSGFSRIYCWVPTTAGGLGLVIILLAGYQAILMRWKISQEPARSPLLHSEKSDDEGTDTMLSPA
jgi:hypothetical protein